MMTSLSDEAVKTLYVAYHDHLMKAARSYDLDGIETWNGRIETYANELRRRFLIVPTVYAMAG